jgi:hypothetical protein
MGGFFGERIESYRKFIHFYHSKRKKELAKFANSSKVLVELRGIEPLTPRLPARPGRFLSRIIRDKRG